MRSPGKYLLSLSLIVVGIIHLLPLSGVLGAERLSALYGISVSGADLEILMRHRAILFALLGAFCIYAALKPAIQLMALIGGAVSVASFLVLACAAESINDEIRRVVIADVVAAVFLAIGFLAYFFGRSAKEHTDE